MALHPAPTIEDHLGLITQRLLNSGSSRPAVVTFAVFNSGGLTAQQVVNAFQANFNTRFAPQFQNTVTLEPPFVNLGDGTSTPQQAVATGAAGAGTSVAASPPSNVAILARKYSTLGGRKNRGRTYFPWFLTEADIDDTGKITGAAVTTIQGRLSGFRSDMITSTVRLVIANKNLLVDPITGKSYVGSITAGPDVSSYICEPIVATQRRRLVR